MQLWQSIWPEEKQDRLILVLALLIAIATGYFLFVYDAEFRNPEDAVKIGLIKTESSVRIRHAKSLRWGTAHNEASIYLKDMVYNPKGYPAEFVWKDKKFILEPETLVQFDEAHLDNLEITLLDGKIKTEPESARFFTVAKIKPKTILFKQNEIVYLPEINPLIIKQSELAARTVEVVERKIQIEPEHGVIVPKLYLNQLADYQLLIKTPLEKTYRHLEREWISFEWVPLPLNEVKYRIQVGVDDNFDDNVGTETKNSFAQILFEQSGTYYWKVSALKKSETINTETRKMVLSPTEGVQVPRRVISSRQDDLPKPLKEQIEQLKRVNQDKKTGNEKEKNPFEILFGK